MLFNLFPGANTMTPIDSLILGPLAIGFLAAGGTASWWNYRITKILKTRHPATWATLRDSLFPKRTAFGNFLMGDQPQRLKDPELLRAVRLSKIAGTTFIACLIAGSIAMICLGTWQR